MDRNIKQIEELVLENRPIQYRILESILEIVTESPFVDSVIVRGSLASRNHDRASDVDVVICIDDNQFPEFIAIFQEMMREMFSLVLPPWQDKIVPNFGGIGFVYLLIWDEKIYQLDTYLAPASRAESIVGASRGQKIWKREKNQGDLSKDSSPDGNTIISVSRERSSNQRIYHGSRYDNSDSNEEIPRGTVKPQTPLRENHLARETLVEILVLGYLLRKRMLRQQIFLNYSETNLLVIAFRNLVRSVLDPQFINYGWYHFAENIENHPFGRKAIGILTNLVTHKATMTPRDLWSSLQEIIAFSRMLCPDVIAELDRGLECYFSEMKRTLFPFGSEFYEQP